ncbi:hypothetical protein BDV12DRAFT_162582 [Aspergillus spectabilis]
MLRVLVEPDSLKKDFVIERNHLPPSSCFAVLPIDGFGNVLQSTSFHPQANLVQQPETMRGEAQARGGEFSHWHTDFPSSHNTSSHNILSNSFRSQSLSQSPNHWKLHTHSQASPESQLTVEDIGSVRHSDPVPALIHPVPRQSPYTVTSYFASETLPESISAFGQTKSSHEDRVSEVDKCLMRGSDWATDDLVFPSLLQGRQSPGTTSVTTVTENYTPVTTDGTYNDGPVTPWSSLTAQVPWTVQQLNDTRDENEAAWNDARGYSNISQQQDHFDQYPAANDDVNGLPSLGPSDQTYVQPSSLLGSYRSTCPSSAYVDCSAIPHPELNQTQSLGDSFAYQNGPRLNDTTDSFFDSFGHIPCQPNQTDRMGPWTNDARNAFLIEYKRRGLSYKDIKRLGGFKEAESTLRGRFRTLTKSKEQRVRKPHWYENDVSPWQKSQWVSGFADCAQVRLLCEAVNIYSEAGDSPCASACRPRRASQSPKIPWKKVAQYIRSHGGSYHFGNATCKKKWCEVSGRR